MHSPIRMFHIKDFRYEITRKCNMFCPHCYANANAQAENSRLPSSVVEKVISDLLDMGLEKFSFTGGEPLYAYEDILRYARILSPRGVYLRIFSNGTLFTNERITELKKAKINEIIISIDGIKSTHDTFRGVDGAFEKAIDTLKLLQPHFVTVARITITSKNYHEIPDLMEEYLLPLCLNKYNIKFFIPCGRGINNLDYVCTSGQHHEVMKYLTHVQKQGYNISFLSNCYAFLWQGIDKFCTCGKHQAYMTCTGDIQPCGYINVSLGNVQTQSIKDIWKSEHPVLKFLRKPQPYDRCKKCIHFTQCRGGCKASSYAIYGDIRRTDVLCPIGGGIYAPSTRK